MPRRTQARRVVPSVITMLALSCGFSAVPFAIDGHYQAAVTAIVLAGALDLVDGRMARLLDATSAMGAELDSLSDTIVFGAAPPLVLFTWRLHEYRAGWVVTLLFVVCMILRVARFNVQRDDSEQPPYSQGFFVGVPAPPGAILLMLPLILSLRIGEGWWTDQAVVTVWTVVAAALVVSNIPTLSTKLIKVSAKTAAPLAVVVGALAVGLIAFLLDTMIVTSALYLLHIPYAVYRRFWLARHPEAWAAESHDRIPA